MKAGWQLRKFGDVCELRKGRKPNLTSIPSDGDKPYLVAKCLRGGGPLEFASVSDKNSILVDPYEIIIICDGSNSGETFIGFDGVLSSTMAKIAHGDEIDNKFLMYFLDSLFEEFNAGKTGAAIPHLDLPSLKEQLLPVPPLAEQRHIVAILDAAFDGIAQATASAEQNLRNARALFESHLQSVFTRRGKGWEERRLADISKEFGRGKSKHRPRNDPRLYGGKYPFIQTGDVRNADHLIIAYSQTYNEAGLAQSKLWPKGTLCITIAANIAETGILDFDACFPDSVVGVVVDERQTSNKFLEYLLQSFKVHLQEQGKGSAQDNINIGTFEKQLFPFPGLPEQKEIVETLDGLRQETQRLESRYRRKLALLSELKQSLLHKAFSGDL